MGMWSMVVVVQASRLHLLLRILWLLWCRRPACIRNCRRDACTTIKFCAGAAERPICRRGAHLGLHRIHFRVLNHLSQAVHISNEMIKRLAFPHSACSSADTVDFMRAEAFPAMQDA